MERFRPSSRNRGLSNASCQGPSVSTSAPSTPPKILKQLPSKFSWSESGHDSPRSLAGRLEDLSFASPPHANARTERACSLVHNGQSPSANVHVVLTTQQRELSNHFRNWSFDTERDLPDCYLDVPSSTSLDSCISPKSKLKTKTPPRTRPHLLRAATVAAAAAESPPGPLHAVPTAPATASPGEDDVLKSEFADSSDEEELANSGMSSRKPFAIARRFLKTSRGGSTTSILIREHRSDSTDSLSSIPTAGPRMLIFGPPSSSSSGGPPSLTSASASTSAGSSLAFSPRDNETSSSLHSDLRASSPSFMASSVSTAASHSTESLLSSSMSASSHSFPSLSKWQVSSAIKLPQRKLSLPRSRSNSQTGSIFGWVQDTRSASTDGRPGSADPLSSSGEFCRTNTHARLARKPSDASLDQQAPQVEATRRGIFHRRNNSHTPAPTGSSTPKKEELRGRRPSTAAGSMLFASVASEVTSLKSNSTRPSGDSHKRLRDASIDTVRSIAESSMDGFYDPQARDQLTASPAPMRPALRSSYTLPANSEVPPRAATPAGIRGQTYPVALNYDRSRRPKLGSQVHSSPHLRTQRPPATSTLPSHSKSGTTVPPRPPPPAFPPPPLPGMGDAAIHTDVPARGDSLEHSRSRSASHSRPASPYSYREGGEFGVQPDNGTQRQNLETGSGSYPMTRSGPQYLAPPRAPSRSGQSPNPMVALDPASLRALQRAARAAAARASSTSTLSIVLGEESGRGGSGDAVPASSGDASNECSTKSIAIPGSENALELESPGCRPRVSKESKSSSGSDSGICRRFSSESSDGDHFIKITKSPIGLGRGGSSSGSGSDERHVFVLSPLPPGEDSDDSASEGEAEPHSDAEHYADVSRGSEDRARNSSSSRVRTIPLILPASLCRSPRTTPRVFKIQTQAHAQQQSLLPSAQMQRSQATAAVGRQDTHGFSL